VTHFSETAETHQLTKRIVGDLTKGLSVLLTGLPGSGRSHLTQLAVQELKFQGANVVMLRGNSLLVDRPLSALNLSDPQGDDAARVANTSLRAYGAGRLDALVEPPQSILVLDDADEMDPLTAGLIANMRSRRKVPLLVIAVSEVDPGPVVDKLVAATQPGVELHLGGLTFEGVTRMVRGLLDGPISAKALSQIATMSGGLPRLIESIVGLSVGNGRLTRRDGVWVANGDLWDPGLRFCLRPLLRGLTRDDVDVLTRVAEGDVVNSGSPDSVRRLIQRGVLCHDQVSPNGYVFPPALAEWLRRDCGQPESFAHQLQAATVDLGHWPTDLTGGEASRISDQIRTHWHADVARLWRAWNDDRMPATAVPLLVALFSGVVNDDRAEVVVTKTKRGGADREAWAEFGVLAAFYRAEGQRDFAGAMADLDQLRRDLPECSERIVAYSYHLILSPRRLLQAGDVDIPDGESSQADIVAVTRIETLIAQGRVQDAVERLAQLEATHRSAMLMSQTLEEMALVLGDDVSAGVELAVRRLWDSLMSLDVLTVLGHAYVAGLGLSLLGRLDELQSIVEIVYRLGDSNIFQNRYKTGLFMLGYYVSTWQGRSDYAHNLAVQAQSLSTAIGPFPGMVGDSYRGWSTGRMWGKVDDLVASGYLTAAVFLAVRVVETDLKSGRSAAVIQHGLGAQSPVVRSLARYMSAMASGDVSQFPEVVADLGDNCGPLDATQATVTWALLLRHQGDIDGFLGKASDAWNESARIAGECPGLFQRLIDDIGLTKREAHVARLASDGFSAQEIAGKVGAAPRTVETHLHAVYRKTGVTSREQLRELVVTWLNLPVEA